MLLDSDFDIIKKTNDLVKFAGIRRAIFTSNIITIEDEEGLHEAAMANIIDDNDEVMYRVSVIFPKEDIVYHAGTYYAPAYAIPVDYKKGHPIVDAYGRKKGILLKGHSFELESSKTLIREVEFYNRKTGNREITKKYSIFTSAESLKRIEDINTGMYRVVIYDTAVEDTKKIEDEVKNFHGIYKVEFTTGVYKRNDNLFAKALIDGNVVEVNMSNMPMKITEPNRWAPYYTYKPIIKGRGCDIKKHCFEIEVLATKVGSRNVWDDSLNVTRVSHNYTVEIVDIVKAKK